MFESADRINGSSDYSYMSEAEKILKLAEDQIDYAEKMVQFSVQSKIVLQNMAMTIFVEDMVDATFGDKDETTLKDSWPYNQNSVLGKSMDQYL
jgi:hypothetical protein